MEPRSVRSIHLRPKWTVMDFPNLCPEFYSAYQHSATFRPQRIVSRRFLLKPAVNMGAHGNMVPASSRIERLFRDPGSAIKLEGKSPSVRRFTRVGWIGASLDQAKILRIGQRQHYEVEWRTRWLITAVNSPRSGSCEACTTSLSRGREARDQFARQDRRTSLGTSV